MKRKTEESQYIHSRLNNEMLNYRVYVPGKLEKVSVRLVLFLAGGFAGLLFYGGLFLSEGEPTTATYAANTIAFIVIGGLAARLFMPVYISRCLEKRRRKLKAQFKEMLASLSASISSGSNVQKAFEDALSDLRLQYEDHDFIIIEMQEILNGVAQNINFEVMVKDFGERSDNEDIVCFADVFEVCYRKGGDLRSVIQKTYHAINEKMAVTDEIETKLTSNKMQHNVMSIMPIVVVAMLKFTNDTFADNFATPVGVLVNTIAIGIFIASYRYGLKICDIRV